MISEKKTAWAIVILYVVLIFITLGDIVPIVEFMERKLGGNFNLAMSLTPYIFFTCFFIYIAFIKKEKHPAKYVYIVLILIAFFLIMRFLRYPVEKVHLIEYSIFGALFFWVTTLYGFSILGSYGVTILAALLVGGMDEVIQSLIPSRFFDVRDILINFQSGVLGAAIFAGFFRETDGEKKGEVKDEVAQE